MSGSVKNIAGGRQTRLNGTANGLRAALFVYPALDCLLTCCNGWLVRIAVNIIKMSFGCGR